MFCITRLHLNLSNFLKFFEIFLMFVTSAPNEDFGRKCAVFMQTLFTD